MDSIIAHGTQVLAYLSIGIKTIERKWIFKKKLNPDGSVNKYEGRLAVKGSKQKKGLDYFDTYYLVSRMNTIRILIALAASYNLEIRQMDVKTAFLNGDLEENLYGATWGICNS